MEETRKIGAIDENSTIIINKNKNLDDMENDFFIFRALREVGKAFLITVDLYLFR